MDSDPILSEHETRKFVQNATQLDEHGKRMKETVKEFNELKTRIRDALKSMPEGEQKLLLGDWEVSLSKSEVPASITEALVQDKLLEVGVDPDVVREAVSKIFGPERGTTTRFRVIQKRISSS